MYVSGLASSTGVLAEPLGHERRQAPARGAIAHVS